MMTINEYQQRAMASLNPELKGRDVLINYRVFLCIQRNYLDNSVEDNQNQYLCCQRQIRGLSFLEIQ